jgi:hypothetical protein
MPRHTGEHRGIAGTILTATCAAPEDERKGFVKAPSVAAIVPIERPRVRQYAQCQGYVGRQPGLPPTESASRLGLPGTPPVGVARHTVRARLAPPTNGTHAHRLRVTSSTPSPARWSAAGIARGTCLSTALQKSRADEGIPPSTCPYCAHIFALDRREPLVENAPSQVRGTLSSMTVDDLARGSSPAYRPAPPPHGSACLPA